MTMSTVAAERRGRPAVGPDVKFKIPEEVRDILRDYAKARGIPVAELHRNILVMAAEQISFLNQPIARVKR